MVVLEKGYLISKGSRSFQSNRRKGPGKLVEELWDNKRPCRHRAGCAERSHTSQQVALQRPQPHGSLVCIKMPRASAERKEGSCKSTILLVSL